MSELGLGVMLNMLAGNEDSVKTLQNGIGKIITKLYLDNNCLNFVFDDGYKMRLQDCGQSCCEVRYMATDDNLLEFVGSKLLDIEVRDGPEEGSEEVHEIQFLLITTSFGVFTMVNHNEHNGYYGEFSIQAIEG